MFSPTHNMMKHIESDQVPRSDNISLLTTISDKGHVFFFYRPMNTEAAYEQHMDWWNRPHKVESIADVSRFYMLLKPEKTLLSRGQKNRLLTMTSKMMPSASEHDRRGAVVSMVSDDISDITTYLAGLKSWEGLSVPAARPCGEGVYELVRHGFAGDLHFIYELEIPTVPRQVQLAFNIEKQASYVVYAKNPDHIQDMYHKPQMTKAQMEHFRGQKVDWMKWAPLVPEFLDVLFAEFVFVGLSTELLSEDKGRGLVALGLEAQDDMEMEDARYKFGEDNTDEKVFNDLNVPKAQLGPKDGLVTGQFV